MRPARVAVAWSGGRDSTALLHATLRAAEPLGIAVVALHVHHGLSPNADAWLARGRALCARWARSGHAVTFVYERILSAPARGESVEAWARVARYAALREMALAHGATLVLLAHHRRDQAETFLLQALRSAGVAGLAGMPRHVNRDEITWARPWLLWPREAVEAYLHRHRLSSIEDETNGDVRFARNRLRAQLWASLVASFPHAEVALAAAAGWAQEAAVCLAELAMLDLDRIAPGGVLDLAAWAELSAPRRSNALRAWLRRVGGKTPSAALVVRLAAELPSCRSARWPVEDGELRSHRGALTFARVATFAAAEAAAVRSVARETTLDVRRAGTYALPGWGGALRATRVRSGGIAAEVLRGLDLVERSGAEQFQVGPGRPARSLKKQYQAAGIAAWQRNGPLIYSAGRLVYVPGLGHDARMLAATDAVQMTLTWIANCAAS